MNKQKSRVVSGKSGRPAEPARVRALRLAGSAAVIKACTDLVVQFDAHRFGAAIVLGIIALATVCVVAVASASAQRGAPASRDIE